LPDYIYLTHPLREGFFEDPTAEEKALLAAHFNYLDSALQEGQVVLAGPCQDRTFGLVVFHARDEDSANKFMMNDPVVKNNVMMAELHPFKISLPGTK
jgi:uncharacterized protein YciI